MKMERTSAKRNEGKYVITLSDVFSKYSSVQISYPSVQISSKRHDKYQAHDKLVILIPTRLFIEQISVTFIDPNRVDGQLSGVMFKSFKRAAVCFIDNTLQH